MRRSTGPWTPAVHALLRHLERAGFDGAPRVLGIDGRGREVLTYVPGEVPCQARPEIVTDRALDEVGRLLRRFHDTVLNFELPSGIRWHHEPIPGPKQLVCHNDLSPRNTVFRDGRPVAFLDWDFTHPAPPMWDVVHAAWQFVPLTDDAGCVRHGWPSPPDRFRRLRMLCDAYCLTEEDRMVFSKLALRRMEATASGIEALATAGTPAYVRLSAAGIPMMIRTEREWVERHAEDPDAAFE